KPFDSATGYWFAFFRGRLTVGRRALNPQALARLQPPELVGECPWSVLERTVVSEAARPGSTPGRDTGSYFPGVWWTHAAVRKRRLMQVRFLPGKLWPNPKRQRSPAVNRVGVGSTPTGHPRPAG